MKKNESELIIRRAQVAKQLITLNRASFQNAIL